MSTATSVLPRQIQMAYPILNPLFYMLYDLPMLLATPPNTANHFTVAYSLALFAALRKYMKPIIGGIDLTTREGRAWRPWRTH